MVVVKDFINFQVSIFIQSPDSMVGKSSLGSSMTKEIKIGLASSFLGSHMNSSSSNLGSCTSSSYFTATTSVVVLRIWC